MTGIMGRNRSALYDGVHTIAAVYWHTKKCQWRPPAGLDRTIMWSVLPAHTLWYPPWMYSATMGVAIPPTPPAPYSPLLLFGLCEPMYGFLETVKSCFEYVALGQTYTHKKRWQSRYIIGYICRGIDVTRRREINMMIEMIGYREVADASCWLLKSIRRKTSE